MESNKPIIAVDCDDVLLLHFQNLIDWYNSRYGTKLELADNGNEDLDRWGAKSVDEAIRNVQAFFETDEFKKAEPMRDAKASLSRLKRYYDLIIVTARDTIIEATTRDWVNEHFMELFGDVHFAAKYSLEGKRRSKAKILRSTGAQYLIDDSLDNIEAAISEGLTAILFGNYPWNQVDTLPTGVIRCSDWQAVEEYFDGLAG
jgi:5'(3')-deoxyribonucleotidase